MPIDRTAFWNVHFSDASTGRPSGGCYQAGSFTEQNILWILENILLVSEAPWTIQCRRSGCIITSTNNILSPSDYEVHSSRPIRVSDEPCVGGQGLACMVRPLLYQYGEEVIELFCPSSLDLGQHV
ncbi:hypothetical protein ACJ73_08278 [Blastomyces percursus]|uniref:DUF7881 domain-containing protein n=1 Tax=Blastomyces percursus TaxID=1658174 RepID=A0A1J9QX10_9EURO|nr:hypothetical protein ACJ73_08278 [Blastomyces percursus]